MPRSHRDALDPDLRRTAWRIGVQTAVLLLGCLVVVGAVVLLSVIQSQEEQLRQSLSAAAVRRPDPTAGTPTETAIAICHNPAAGSRPRCCTPGRSTRLDRSRPVCRI